MVFGISVTIENTTVTVFIQKFDDGVTVIFKKSMVYGNSKPRKSRNDRS